MGNGKARGGRWEEEKGASLLSFSFPAFSVHFRFSLSPAAARKTKEASAEEKLRSKQDESNFRACTSRTLSSRLNCQKRQDIPLVWEVR